MRYRSAAIGVMAISLALLGACSDAGPLFQPTDEEEDYLATVVALETDVSNAIDEIGAALEITWPVRSRLFDVVGEANLTDLFESTLEKAEALTPPDRFSSDHARFIKLWKGAVELSRGQDQAIENEDLVEVYLARAAFFAALSNFLVGVSHEFCIATYPAELGEGAPGSVWAQGSRVCGGEGPLLPGGEYGLRLYDVMRQYQADFRSRVVSFPLMMSPEELSTALVRLNPEIEDAIEQALEAARQLEPPSEFLTDHDHLMQYFEENLELSRAITGAARDGDEKKLRDEYFPQSGAVLNRATDGFSDKFRVLVSPYFGFDEGAGEP